MCRKKNIEYRADFDAVLIPETIDIPYASMNPRVSHKCGHDGHSATLAGFALEIDQDGAAQCAVFIKENNIEGIFAYHNMSGMELNSINVSSYSY